MKKNGLLTESVSGSSKEPVALRITGIILSLLVCSYIFIVLIYAPSHIWLEADGIPIIIGVLIFLFSAFFLGAPTSMYMSMYKKPQIGCLALLWVVFLVVTSIFGIIIAFDLFIVASMLSEEGVAIGLFIIVMVVPVLLFFTSALTILLRLRWVGNQR